MFNYKVSLPQNNKHILCNSTNIIKNILLPFESTNIQQVRWSKVSAGVVSASDGCVMNAAGVDTLWWFVTRRHEPLKVPLWRVALNTGTDTSQPWGPGFFMGFFFLFYVEPLWMFLWARSKNLQAEWTEIPQSPVWMDPRQFTEIWTFCSESLQLVKEHIYTIILLHF